MVLPVRYNTPRTVQLASQALPAAGAFTSQAFTSLLEGAKEVNYWITYTRGDAGGYPVIDVQWGNDTEESSELFLDESSFSPSQPLGNANVYIGRLLGPAPADANPVSYLLSCIVPYGATKARLRVAEGGVVGTPGTIAVAFTGGVGAP